MSTKHVRSDPEHAPLPAIRIDPAVWSGGPDRDWSRSLWRRLDERLLQWNPHWQATVSTPKNIPVVAIATFENLSDAAIFEAFALAAISGNARWDRISAVQSQLAEPFQDFSPHRFAELSDQDIDERIVPWFRQRRAGSARLPKVLRLLRGSADLLLPRKDGDARTFLMAAGAQAEGSPEEMAVLLGTDTRFKMPGFGIALAAEALRLLGCDLCKPDRHVLRAIAAWQVVTFKNWPAGEFAAPQARTPELLATMLAVRQLALANGVSTSYATSVIWLAGAVSGARMTNQGLDSLRPSPACPSSS
jgi:hypothetical protein